MVPALWLVKRWLGDVHEARLRALSTDAQQRLRGLIDVTENRWEGSRLSLLTFRSPVRVAAFANLKKLKPLLSRL